MPHNREGLYPPPLGSGYFLGVPTPRALGSPPRSEPVALRATVLVQTQEQRKGAPLGPLFFAPQEGLEPPTRWLTATCSPTELLRNVCQKQGRS